MARTARRALAAMLAPIALLALAGCSDAPSKEAAGPPPSPLLYEIASADGAVEGWMLGTIHALPTGTQWRTPAIAKVTDSADLLVVEIADLDNRSGIAAIFAELGTSPGLPPLEQRLGGDLRPKLVEVMQSSDIDWVSSASLETWAAALTLAQVGAVGDPTAGVDRALIREFAGRPILALEGARRQLSIFDRLPETDQRVLLASVIGNPEQSKADATQLQRAWLTGDLAVLEAATRTGIMADKNLREALLVQRNRGWVAAVLPMLANEARPLIAVGAAHLVGSDGLVAMLAARGFRVRRLP